MCIQVKDSHTGTGLKGGQIFLRTLDMTLPNVFPLYCVGQLQFWQIIFSKDADNISPTCSPHSVTLTPLALNGWVCVFSPFCDCLKQQSMPEVTICDFCLAYKNAKYSHFVLLRYLLLEPSYPAVWKPKKAMERAV